MGYTHYWYREKEIQKDEFKRIANDFKKLLPTFKKLGIDLANADGHEKPIISDEKIAFNGRRRCGHPIMLGFCGGDCSHEPFVFPRILKIQDWNEPVDGKYFDFCKTAMKPYDLAVQTFLIIAKEVLGDKIIVRSDGEEHYWKNAKFICQTILGYGLDTKLDI